MSTDGTTTGGLPGRDLVVAILDAVSERALGRPLRPDLRVSPLGLLRGEIDLVKIELPAYAVAGLVVDRVVIAAERLRVVPGLPPTVRADPVRFSTVVTQASADRWTQTSRLPLRFHLTATGITTTTGVAGIRVGEVETELRVHRNMLQLRPTRASMLGVPAPLVQVLRGYLPLPPLPNGARLTGVDSTEGEVRVDFEIEHFSQSVSFDTHLRLLRLLGRRPGSA